MIGIGIIVIFFCIALAYLGYRYMDNKKYDNNKVNTTNEKNIEMTEVEKIDGASKDIDNEIESILKNIEEETVDIDFEDFDSELEFGVQ